MIKKRFYFLVAVHAFLLQDEHILLLERANTGYMDGFLSVPAGHVDGGETIWEAMKREVKEEVGVELTTEVKPAHVMHRIKSEEERIDYFYIIRNWKGDITNVEPQKCAKIAWVGLKDLPKFQTIPYILFAIDQVEKGNYFSEFKE